MAGHIMMDQTYFGYNTFWNILTWTIYHHPPPRPEMKIVYGQLRP